jgi:hypothetical protein
MDCPLCGKDVIAGEAYALHHCEPRVTALHYAGPRSQRIEYSPRYGWRLCRRRLAISSLTLDEVVELTGRGFLPKGTDSDDDAKEARSGS